MADAEDLKSSGDFSSCGFDSHPGHHFLRSLRGFLSANEIRAFSSGAKIGSLLLIFDLSMRLASVWSCRTTCPSWKKRSSRTNASQTQQGCRKMTNLA